jgi:hypothetical protein
MARIDSKLRALAERRLYTDITLHISYQAREVWQQP